MDQTSTIQWKDRIAQQLVCYEALVKLLDDIHPLEDISEISSHVARQWKYFANVVCWRLIIPKINSFLVIDGFRGEASVKDTSHLSDWDAYHLKTKLPFLKRIEDLPAHPLAPKHLINEAVVEIEVIPFLRTGRCIGLLSVAARHESFSDLDKKFIRIFGSHFTDRIFSILLRQQNIEYAHKVGMSDIASNILHNVGNTLNSLKTSSFMLMQSAANSKVTDLVKANTLLKEKLDDLEGFFIKSPNGIKLLNYYLDLGDALAAESESTIDSIQRIQKNIETIAVMISAQQEFIFSSELPEPLDLCEIVENTLTLCANDLNRLGITVSKLLSPVPKIKGNKVKLMHIFINLFKNAEEAILKNDSETKRIQVMVKQVQQNVLVTVFDNGCGIQPEHLKKIFSLGFSSKKNSQGIGLHSSAVYVSEMKGQIWAESEGSGQGTTIHVSFPLFTK